MATSKPKKKIKSLTEKLAIVQAGLDYFKKENKSFSYKYVSNSQVVSKVRQLMNEQKLLLVKSTTPVAIHLISSKNNKGKEITNILTEILITFTWVNVESPDERETFTQYSQGFDTDSEKGVGKAETYGEKTFLMKFFHVPADEEDPDVFHEKTMNYMSAEKQQTTINFLADRAKKIAEITGVKDRDIFADILRRTGFDKKHDTEESGRQAMEYANEKLKEKEESIKNETKEENQPDDIPEFPDDQQNPLA